MAERGHSRKKPSQSAGGGHFGAVAVIIVLLVLAAAILVRIDMGKRDGHRVAEMDGEKIAGGDEGSVAEENRDGGSRPEDAKPADPSGPGESTADFSSAPSSPSTPADTIDSRIQDILSRMTLNQKVAQLFIITPEALTGYTTVTRAGDATRCALQEYPVGGLIYFSQNLQTPDQFREMTGETQEYALALQGFPLFLSIDEEGGTVARLANHSGFGLPRVDTMAGIGAGGDPAKAYEAGSLIGAYLEDFGINLNYAPDADVLTNPKNTVVRDRSFGSDPELVAQMAEAYLKGLEEHRVYGTPKHFPGHGATEGDSHMGFAYTGKTWEELEKAELVPFARMIADGTPFLMAGHISAPAITGDDTPSSLSRQMLTGYLRDTMGYDGIIITDALNMGAIQDNYPSGKAAVMAFTAGADLLLMPADFKEAYNGILDAVQNGDVTEKRIDESLTRILKVKLEWMESKKG